MNRRSFLRTVTGCAVAATAVKPAGQYVTMIMDINCATKTVTFNSEWFEGPWPPKMPPMVLSFAPTDDKDKVKRRYLSPGMTMEVL